MAEGAILFLIIGKITGALAQEAVKWTGSVAAEEVKLLSQVRSRISQIKSEFEVIQAFLDYTDAWKDNHPVLEAWVKQVRELAFDVEDVIDEYTLLLGEGDRDALGWLRNKGRALRQSRNLRRWHGMANHLKEILERLHHLRDMKDRYGIVTSRGSDASGSSGERRQNMAEDAHFIDNSDIVGFDDDRRTLVQWLTVTDEREGGGLTITSVWGMGGLGKTTLVTKVYHEVKGHFSHHAWVTVSQIYRADDLLKKIIKELLRGKEELAVEGAEINNIDTMGHVDLTRKLRDILKEERYIIVLDDVWSPTVWEDIRVALGGGSSGCRIVLTTRHSHVASLAAEKYRMELRPLSEDKALELLTMRAFPRDGGEECPEHLKDVATKIVHKCGRLPLAIVSLGRILSLREKEETEWKKVIDGLEWELRNNPELDQLKSALLLSYKDLPNYLKHSFLYCSIFPEDYYMRRKRLIRLWIAEGFVQRRGRQTLEDAAEDNLNALVYRCLLQVKRNDFGRVKFCRMHDMMRELVLSLSEREGLCHVYEHSQRMLEGKVRRLSVHNCGDQNEIRNVSMSHIRSLLLFKPAKLGFRSFRLLRVLDLQRSPLERLPDAAWDLFNLHYLSLRKTEVNTIPSSLQRLVYLQTLDLAFTKIKKLPNGLSKLTHLRNLFVHTIRDSTSESYNYFSGCPAPKGIWNLENLHTLQGVEANRKMVGHLENMVQLRTFRIIKVRAAHHDKLCAALKRMENLHRLDIVAATEHRRDELALGALSPPPPCLQKLTLRGRLQFGALPKWFCDLKNLTWLRLGWSGLSQDPLPCLQALPNLVFLLLLRAYDGEELCFKEGFHKLRDLRLVDMMNLEQVQISVGALQNLRQLHLVRCLRLQEFPTGLKHLTTWEAAFLEDMPESLLFGELEGDRRIRRLPSTNVPRTDGKWPGQQPTSSSHRGHPLENHNTEGAMTRETEGQGKTGL